MFYVEDFAKIVERVGRNRWLDIVVWTGCIEVVQICAIVAVMDDGKVYEDGCEGEDGRAEISLEESIVNTNMVHVKILDR